MASCSSTIERKTPRLSRRRVSAEKKVSTAFSHEPEVGVKWKVQRGCRASQASTLGWGGRLRSASMCHDRVVQPDREPSAMTPTTIGLDLAKLVFQVHGVDESGRAVLQRKLHRHEVATFFEELPRL